MVSGVHLFGDWSDLPGSLFIRFTFLVGLDGMGGDLLPFLFFPLPLPGESFLFMSSAENPLSGAFFIFGSVLGFRLMDLNLSEGGIPTAILFPGEALGMGVLASLSLGVCASC